MTETIDRTPIDRTGWGAGPWDGEPDRIEWEHSGLPCLMVRHPSLGHWCGYAAVNPDHPMHGKDYDAVFTYDEDEADDGYEHCPHGGLTYASLCSHNVCHVPKPGEPENVWWFGFDCAHSEDLSPGMVASTRRFYDEHPEFRHLHDRDVYREVPYVQAQTNMLASYLAGTAA